MFQLPINTQGRTLKPNKLLWYLHSLDATQNDGRLGRLINHSRGGANVLTKVIEIEGCPHLCFIAARGIKKGEELQYDYGDRRRAIVNTFPWLLS